MALTEREQFALEQLTPEERDQLERDTVALIDRMTADVLRVLGTYAPPERPREGRWLAMHSAANATAQLMRSVLADEGEDARPKVVTLADHLALLAHTTHASGVTH